MARPAIKKQDIENGAIRLFATNGLAGTTIKDIATEAGVTEGALYRHYSGKNEMARELYSREAKIFFSGFKPILDDEAKTFPQRMHDVISFIYDYYQENPDRLIFVVLTRQSFPGQAERGASQVFDRDMMIAEYFRKEMERGTTEKDDPLLIMALIRGMILEPIMMHRCGSLNQWPAKYVNEITQACLKVLGSKDMNFK